MRSIPVLLACAPALLAQASLPLRPGLACETVYVQRTTPYALHGVATDLTGRDVYCARGHEVVRLDAQGPVPVHAFGPQDQIGAIMRPGAGLELLVTNLTRDQLLRRHLYTAQSSLGAAPRNTFDLELAPGGTILASANPLWPGPGARTGVWRVDAGGAHREVVALRGPSGPLAFGPGGDLFVAVLPDTVPPPPGSVTILRFDAARVQQAVASGPALREADGTAAWRGLDGAYDLAFDDRGRLVVTDPRPGGILRLDLRNARQESLSPPPTAPDTLTALTLQFVDVGAATFDPFQPAHGTALFVGASDWQTSCHVFRVVAQRPALDVTPPQTGPGPVRFAAQGAPPGGVVALCLSAAPLLPERVLLELGGLPLWFALDFGAPVVLAVLAADHAGGARFDFVYAGGFAGPVHGQAIGLAPLTGDAGTSPAVTLLLRP